ncbi:MAG: MFS transporter [Pelosinus sp.]|nr:MFS transporter [Pelosinus sp.]
MNWRRNLWTLLAAVMLSSSSYTMVIPFLPLYLLELGVSTESINMWSGIIFSISFFIGGVMAPYWGRLADKTGKKRMVLRAGFSLAAVYFLGAFVQSPLQLFLVRMLQGFANGFFPASLSIVASSVPKEKMGYSLGMMQTGVLLGGILGPLLGGGLSHLFGMRLSFIVSAAAIFGGTLAVKFLVVEASSKTQTGQGSMLDDFKTAYHNSKLVEMLLLLFVAQLATVMLQPLLTLYIAELQGKMEGAGLTAGIVYSLAGAAGAIAAPLWGKFGQHKGFYRILVLAFFGAGTFNLGQFFVGEIYKFAVLQFIFGLFIVGVYPAINTIAVSSSPKNFQGRVFGLTTTANQMGSMAGPLIGGAISSWYGIRPVFLFTGSLLLIVGLSVLVRHSKVKIVQKS